LEETQSLIAANRAAIRHAQHYHLRTARSSFDANPAARVHRMLAGDELPSEIRAVVDEHDSLTTTPRQLEDVMVTHFEGVFAIPLPPPPALSPRAAAPAAPDPPTPPEMLFQKPSIQPGWFDGLMDAPTQAELVRLLSDAPLVSSPGLDGVSVGLWKQAVQRVPSVRVHMLALFASCLRTSAFPSAWKTSVIVPLVKDASKERLMTNIRPISLQSCLGKLLGKLLARRLGTILQRHPILNPAQRGFVLGGNSAKCIDEVLDAWDWSRGGQKHELYTIFYDIAQAYDSVEREPLERAMKRLNLPEPFVRLVISSLSGLTSCIRTVHGLSRQFAVHRSLRQGDPLAPLLFIILMDGLHDGLLRNPFTGSFHGCTLTYGRVPHKIPSVGFADDTGVLANTLADLAVQNSWVQYFMRFNRLRLNAKKSELVGRGADGAPVTAAALALHDITIEGVAITPVDHSRPIRYLGVHSTFDGDWSEQRRRAVSMIAMFTRVAVKFKLSVRDAVYMFNTFLITKLELALRYVHGPGTAAWLAGCDRLLFGTVRHLVKSPLLLSHSTLSVLLGLRMPSRMEQVIKVSELFQRLNSSDAQWGSLGRTIARAHLPSTASAHAAAPVLPALERCNRVARAAGLLAKQLLWSSTLSAPESNRPGHRREHLFAQSSPVAGVPTHATASSTVHFAEGPIHIAHDCWTGWSGPLDSLHHTVDVYTDGSYSSDSGQSSWSVALGTAWLDDHHHSVPLEHQLTLNHVGGATLIGSDISCTSGIYPAELQAIARALAMLPLSLHLVVHSDSQSSIAAIGAFDSEHNERRRLRMAARTILQLLQSLLVRRRAAGGTARFLHVAAHSDCTDIHSVGNRLADLRANTSRGNVHSSPNGLRQLPLHACEPYFHLVDERSRTIINDIRHTARARVDALSFEKWLLRLDDQGDFACEGILALSRVVMSIGSPGEQQALVHCATNSVHQYWPLPPAGDGRGARDASPLLKLQCDDCAVPLTIGHLAVCPSLRATQTRAALCNIILRHLGALPHCASWLRSRLLVGPGRPPPLLSRLLLSLFPLPAAASPSDAARHLPRCMIGGFTTRECGHAARLLLFPSHADGRSAVDHLRLKCLHFVFAHFQSLKPSPPPAPRVR
jgi:hypothetical protein